MYHYEYVPTSSQNSVSLGEPEISITTNNAGMSVSYDSERSIVLVTLPSDFKVGDSYEIAFNAVNIVLEIDGTIYNINPDQRTTLTINIVEEVVTVCYHSTACSNNANPSGLCDACEAGEKRITEPRENEKYFHAPHLTCENCDYDVWDISGLEPCVFNNEGKCEICGRVETLKECLHYEKCGNTTFGELCSSCVDSCEETMDKNETTHRWEGVYLCCGFTEVIEEPHEFTNGVCEWCGYEKTEGEEITDLKAVTNLRWSDTTPGQAVFYNPNEENVSFTLQCFKDDAQYPMASWSTSASNPGDVTLPVHFDITESGNYKYQIKVYAYGVEPDWNYETGCVSEWSSVFTYTRPSKQVAVPTNIKWDSNGKVTWDKAEHANHYWSYLYVKDSSYTWNDGYRPMGGSGSMDNFHDYSSKLGDGYEYYVRVKANSENINKYANGDYSEYIPFKKNEVADKVNGTLDIVVPKEITTENVQQAVSDVKEIFKDDTSKGELQVAMQTDEATRDKIAALEEQYMTSKNVTTAFSQTEDVEIDASSVSILGAGLNATEAGSVEFKMSKPSEEVQKDLVTNTRFTKAIVLDLGLEGAGITPGQTLDIPVTVTMNPPTGIDVSKLTILHYNEDNTSYEKLPVRRNSDGTISFTVTHFSNFVFGEEGVPDSPEADNKVVVGNNGVTYEVYDVEEAISKAIAKEVEDRIQAEEALKSLPTEVKNMSGKNTVYNISKITTTQGFISAIDKIAKATSVKETVTLYSSEPFAFNRSALTAITDVNRDIVYMFNHKGHLYKITIPAGAKVDISLATFAGPLYIGAQLGTSVLIK